MLSNPLHRYSSYHSIPVTDMLPTGHVPSNHMHGGLDTLAHGSQYALHQLQRQIDVHQDSQSSRSSGSKHRQHPYNSLSGGMSGGRSSGINASHSSGPVRRRISRACDQCNQLRTKCDGQSPCAHCVGMSRLIYRLSITLTPYLRVQSNL
jgi:hypothetical protein